MTTVFDNPKTAIQQTRADDAPPFVLVVDDDSALRLYARKVIQRCGMTVAEAASGRDAIQAISRHAFDCVLLDISMPGLDGFDTCREVRARPDGDRLPVVMITGLDDLQSIKRAYDSGATDFVTKPINWPILEQRIRHLSRGYRTARRLKRSESNRRALLDAVPDTILHMDTAGAVKKLKSAHQRTMLDRRLHRYRSLPDALLDDAAKERVTECLAKLRDGGGVQSFDFELGIGDQSRHYEARMIATDNSECTVMIRDFTERRRSDARIHALAFYDELTRLPNAALIHKQLAQCVEHDVAVMRIAIEELAHIDGVLGHRARSDLIRQAADRLSHSATSSPITSVDGKPSVGRLEGGEFVMLLSPMNDKADLNQLLDTIRVSLGAPFHVQGNDVSVTTKVGVAVFPGDGTQQQILDRAGSALDEAKRQPGACVRFYSSDFHRRRRERMDLEARVRKALDNDEFFLEYQPKVTADTRRVVGVEALVRWRNPQMGVVQPNRFIPLAEQTGLIVPLGERVLDLACQQACEWLSVGCGQIPVAINFSGRQFGQYDVIAGIQGAIARHRIGAAQLEVEITETSVMQIREQITRVLIELREMGVRIAMDDFGTGYSSLGLLRGLPFDILKIDRGFIRHVLTDQGTASITEAMIRMGQAMGMEIVAEGVEEEAQMEFLRQNGCDVIQGYLTGRPVSGDVITQRLIDQHRNQQPVVAIPRVQRTTLR